MFKKAKDIKPLPSGMVDAFTAKVSSQGYKMTETVAEEPAVEVEAQPEEVTEAKASRGADKTGPGDGDTKTPKVADVTPNIGMISSKDKAAKSVETAVKAASQPSMKEGYMSKEQMINATYAEMKKMSYEGLCGMAEKHKMKCGSRGDKKEQLHAMYGEMKSMSEKRINAMYESSCGTRREEFEIVQDGGTVEVVDIEEGKVECPKCEGKGCDHCDGKGYHMKEDNSNDKSDDGEGMDKVQPKAVKKKFDDRKDKDIDNDGDEDESDEYLHRRRKAISKALED